MNDMDPGPTVHHELQFTLGGLWEFAASQKQYLEEGYSRRTRSTLAVDSVLQALIGHLKSYSLS